MFVFPQFLKKASRRIPWNSEVLARSPEHQRSLPLFLLSLRRQKHQLYNLLCPLKMCCCRLQEHSTSEHLPSLLSKRASLTKRRTIITEDNLVDKWVVHPPDSTDCLWSNLTSMDRTTINIHRCWGGGLHKSLQLLWHCQNLCPSLSSEFQENMHSNTIKAAANCV